MKSLEKLVEQLARAIGLDGAELAERKAFLEFAAADAQWLSKLHGPLESARAAFIEAFYDHLKQFPETARLIDDPEILTRLKQTQSDYFDRLTGGDYNDDYVHDRLRVGAAHQRVGLEPKWYVGAYSRYLCNLLPEIQRICAGDSPDTIAAACQSLVKIIFLDMGLALDTYIYADRRQIVGLKNYAEKIICRIPAGLLVLSDELVVLSSNRPFGDIFGVDHESLRGQHLEEVLPLTDLQANAREVLATRIPVYDLPATLRNQGEVKHLEVTLTPFEGEEIEDLTHAAPALLLVVDDLTEKEWLRRQARESETRMRAIMENLAEGVISIDERGIIYSFNRAAQQIFGYTAAEILGKNVNILMPEPYRSGHNGYLERYLRTGESNCLGIGVREVPAQHKDGTIMPIELSTSETRIGNQRMFIGIVRDIKERQLAEEEMRKLSSAVDQTADSIIITDNAGTIQYVNPAFERATGYGRDEAIGGTPAIVRSGIHDKVFYRRLWNTILKGEVFRDVFVNKKKDGSLFYEEKSITPIKSPDGAVTHFVSAGKDITDRMRTQERLDYLAHHDPLTNLPNRTLFMDRLQQAMARARRHRRMVAVLFLDLDRFKVINDTLGHDVGDRLLQAMAHRLRHSVREGDTIARLGGDECAVLVEDASAVSDIPAVASKILNTLARPFTLDNHELFVTTSIGVSLFPEDGEDAHTLLKHADVAMYRAKEKGRNTYQFFTADMNARAHERLHLETGLRRALERNEFVVHYQPQVEIGTGRVISVEALLRWQHPQLGLISPMEFIPLLEETGLINPVGEWVLHQACTQARAWLDTGFHGIRVAINLSAHQLMQHDMVDTVKKALTDTGLGNGNSCLELEITESLLMDNVEATTDKLRQFNTMGVNLSIDDFGTGYSSLAYLKRFPIHTLKIDRTFVRDIAEDPDDAAIVTAVIAMAHKLKLKVIAEGVETDGQLAFLRQYGCDAMQGYLISRPLPADELTVLLREKFYR
jgi:diguanylate cyclase (GGDEF)-like protein/PAS domain S-box-containing protein